MKDLIDILNGDDRILERNDEDELVCPYPELLEPHQLVKMMGFIPRDLGHNIDIYAPLFPLSFCIKQYEDELFESDSITPEQLESAKRYWIYYRKMAEHYKRVDYFNENPTEYYMWLVGSTHNTLGAELRSHWDEVELRH